MTLICATECTRFIDYFFSFRSSLLAVSFEDFEIHVVDVDMKRVVRIFQGHTNRITDMVSKAPGPHRRKSAFETMLFSSKSLSSFWLSAIRVLKELLYVRFSNVECLKME